MSKSRNEGVGSHQLCAYIDYGWWKTGADQRSEGGEGMESGQECTTNLTSPTRSSMARARRPSLSQRPVRMSVLEHHCMWGLGTRVSLAQKDVLQKSGRPHQLSYHNERLEICVPPLCTLLSLSACWRRLHVKASRRTRDMNAVRPYCENNKRTVRKYKRKTHRRIYVVSAIALRRLNDRAPKPQEASRGDMDPKECYISSPAGNMVQPLLSGYHDR
ncbi:hypothetical protein EI94DRAFT_1717209 [Lactarius quietus]|nr:hypothetical protein EI94DRAFT_1717209 [Lactarius quietus]